MFRMAKMSEFLGRLPELLPQFPQFLVLLRNPLTTAKNGFSGSLDKSNEVGAELHEGEQREQREHCEDEHQHGILQLTRSF